MIEEYVDDEFDESIEADPLAPFIDSAYITDVLYTVKSGKEGTVFCCRAHPSQGVGLLAAKLYRDREHRTFKNDSVYQQGRVILNGRTARAVKKRTSFGRQASFGMWLDHEFSTLQTLHALGADVPRPITRTENVILMEYLGDEEQAAQPLHSVRLAEEEVRPLFQMVIRNIELWLANNLIHADLSAYNILYHEGQATIIDFPQAVDPRFNNDAYSLLQRDLDNVCGYFGRYGVRSNPAVMTRHMWNRFTFAQL